MDWVFKFFSSDRLDNHNTKTRESNVASTARVDTELAFAIEELDTFRGRAASRVGGDGVHQIVIGMIARTQQRIAMLNDERIALTVEYPEPFTHDQLVAAWPALNNESRRALLRELIHHIDLAPGRGSPAERLHIVLHSEE